MADWVSVCGIRLENSPRSVLVRKTSPHTSKGRAQVWGTFSSCSIAYTHAEHFQPPIHALVAVDLWFRLTKTWQCHLHPAALLQAVLDPQGKKPCRFFLLGQSPSSNFPYVEIADLFFFLATIMLAVQTKEIFVVKARLGAYHICVCRNHIFLLGFPQQCVLMTFKCIFFQLPLT